MNRTFQIITILFFTWSMIACGDQGEALPELTYRQRELVDTMYMEIVTKMRPVWDSICDAQFEERVAIAVDSLMLVRREEEARLRARVLQEQGQ